MEAELALLVAVARKEKFGYIVYRHKVKIIRMFYQLFSFSSRDLEEFYEEPQTFVNNLILIIDADEEQKIASKFTCLE